MGGLIFAVEEQMDSYAKRTESPHARKDQHPPAPVQDDVVPAEAGTHTPCPLDQLRGMGPGSTAGTTQKIASLILCAVGCAVAALLSPTTARAADTDPCDSLVPAAIGGPL